MSNAVTLPYSTTLDTFGTTLSSPYQWYVQWYQYPTITDTMGSKAQITLNSIQSKSRTKKYNLPSGYTQLEYIESTGTQHINTGYAITQSNINKIKMVHDMEILGSAVNSNRAITIENITDFFQVTHGTYGFMGSGGTFTTNNAGIHSSTATTTLTALADIAAVSFDYSYSSESSYDKLTITYNGTTVANALSGSTTTNSYSGGALKKGQTIVFTYTKDGSGNSYNDQCTFSNMKVSTTKDSWAVHGIGYPNGCHIGTYNGLIYYGNGSADVATTYKYDGIRHVFTNDLLNGKMSVSNLCEVTYTPTTSTGNVNYYLFAYNENGTTTGCNLTRMWHSELYDNDVLVRNYVPCKENSTGNIGMYDTVTNTFYNNNGTGTFAYKEFTDSFVTASFTILSQNPITRTGTSGYTCSDFTFESRPTIKVNNVTLGESIELYDMELSTSVADNGAGTAVSSSITHSATVEVEIPRDWFSAANATWNFSISDTLSIMNSGVSSTNTHTFASFVAPTLMNIWVKMPLGLPSEYTQVEYIESTGTQYVDTLYKPNQDTRMVADIDVTATDAQSALFGARNAYQNNGFALHTWQKNAGYQIDYATNATNVTTVTSSGRHTLDFNGSVLSIDGAVINTYTAATFQCSYTALIFTVHSGDTVLNTNFPTSAKLYSFKIYDNNTLVRDFIPCIKGKGTSSVAGLYDLVNGVFYTNAGTGSFITGNIVSSTSVLKQVQKVFTKKNGVLYEISSLKMRVGDTIV